MNFGGTPLTMETLIFLHQKPAWPLEKSCQDADAACEEHAKNISVLAVVAKSVILKKNARSMWFNHKYPRRLKP